MDGAVFREVAVRIAPDADVEFFQRLGAGGVQLRRQRRQLLLRRRLATLQSLESEYPFVR